MSKKILIKLKWKTKCVSMFSVMETNWLILFTYQIKKLEIQWIFSQYEIKLNHIVCTSKTLTNLCLAKGKAKKNKPVGLFMKVSQF